MPRKRAEYRNELKTRVTDPVYDALQRYKILYRVKTDSEAVERLLEQSLLGVVGSIPALVNSVSVEMDEAGTSRAAA